MSATTPTTNRTATAAPTLAPSEPPAANGGGGPPGLGDRLRASHRLPLLLLAAVCLVSLGTRAAWIGTPSRTVFDEAYYVNAARVIDGIRPPGSVSYSTSPLGLDPNHEHPPLGKVLIAASIKLLGDRPIGWRAPSLLAGTFALLALFALARSAGASRWFALTTTAILSLENLFFVHGRIATLDVLIIPFMLGGAALYLRRRPALAGLCLGVGACIKLVAFAALPVLVLLEVSSALARDRVGAQRVVRQRVLALAGAVLVAAVSYLAVLEMLDVRYSTFGNAVSHTVHMVTYASDQPETPRARPGFTAAAVSKPWQWLLNREPILYYQEVTPPPGPLRPLVVVQGRMSPTVIFLAVPVLIGAGTAFWRTRQRLPALVLAWFGGTFGTLALISLGHNFNYLYYMLITVPGLCIGVTFLLAGRWIPSVVRWCYGAAALYGFWALFPVRSGIFR